MRKKIGLIVAVWFGFTIAAFSQVPWIDAPMVSGSAGQYACITRPTYDQRIALITCNQQIVAMYPPFAQKFLFAHEHGHVYQIVYKPQILMSPYVEYDADCYAATWMVYNDPESLALSIRWFQQVLGPYGGDAIHGNGFQMAQRADQCAEAANPSFHAALRESPRRDYKPPFESGFLDSGPASTQAISSYPRPRGMSKTSDSAFPNVRSDSEPTDCTAIEFLTESAHTSFWEASTASGAIAPAITNALDARCSVVGVLRRRVECSQEPSARVNLSSEVARCLSSKEWEKSCSDESCSTATYRHPGDGQEHVTILVKTEPKGDSLELVAPILSPHSHDSNNYASIKQTAP